MSIQKGPIVEDGEVKRTSQIEKILTKEKKTIDLRAFFENQEMGRPPGLFERCLNI